MSEIQIENIKEKFVKENIDIFTGIGKFLDKVKNKIKENCVAKISQIWIIPIKLIYKLCEQKNIEKCKPDEWEQPLVI